MSKKLLGDEMMVKMDITDERCNDALMYMVKYSKKIDKLVKKKYILYIVLKTADH